MPKKPPRFLNSPFSDGFIKWMSRLNTWMYRRNSGDGLGGTFQKIPVALLTTTGRKTGEPRVSPSVPTTGRNWWTCTRPTRITRPGPTALSR